MNIGMFLIPVSALLMACGNLLGDDIISGMTNITLMMIAGIVIQALAECFISPRYLEYFSLQAPKGEEGMYLYLWFWFSWYFIDEILSGSYFV